MPSETLNNTYRSNFIISSAFEILSFSMKGTLLSHKRSKCQMSKINGKKCNACLDGDKRLPSELQRGKVSPYWTHFPEHRKYERGKHLESSILFKCLNHDKVDGEIMINDTSYLVNICDSLSSLRCVFFIFTLFGWKGTHSFKAL